MTNDTTEIKRVTGDYYEQLYANKLDNLKEMDKFLETWNLPRLNNEEIQSLTRHITSIEIELKAQDQMASQANSIKYLEKS